MTLKWTQGIKGFQFGFINDHVLCVRSGPTVRFQDLQSQVCNVFRLRTNNPTSLVVHPLEPYFAVFEVCQLNPKVFVYRYPNFEETILTGSGELELQQLVFSSSSYLATISGVPDFLLSLCFCPLNWRLIVATDLRYIHVWYVETCNQITMLRSRSTLLPARSVQVGLYHDPSLKADPKQIEPCKDKNNLYPQLPESAISGVTEEKEPEYNDYMDDTDRVICVSQTWSNNELVFIGCKYGELLLVDPSSLSINVLLNPLSRRGLAHESTTDDPTSMTKTSEISISVCNQSEPQTQDASCGLSLPLKCLSFLIFAKQGLYSAGEDGTLRVIGLNAEKSRTPVTTKLPGLTLETQDSKAIPQHMCIRIVSCTKAFVFRNPFNSDGQNETLKITGMAVSPSYSLLALTARSGQMAILRLPEHKEDYGKHLDPQLCLATSGEAFTGFGVLGPDNKSICAVSHLFVKDEIRLFFLKCMCQFPFTYHPVDHNVLTNAPSQWNNG
ncbi:unnamed protein product [Dicrocoelium dendriticum]|nr:unnamed protein product [Dicrocoelium dendriticum]